MHEARTDFEPRWTDVDGALALARATDDRRLEMAALRFLGGDAAVGLGLQVDELVAPLELGLRLAADLGDRRAEADFTSRLAILEASRLRLTTALARAERGLARARSAGSEDALVLALDGLKTVWAYLGDPVRLGEVIAELEPRLRARGDTWLLQWAVFEKSFVPAAEGRLGRRPARWSPRRWSSTGSAATRRTPATCARTTAGSPGWPATSTTARRIGREAVEASLVRRPPVVVRHRRRAARRHAGRDRRPRPRPRRSRGAGWPPASEGRPVAGCAAWRRSPR